jgi:hypothetical protein
MLGSRELILTTKDRGELQGFYFPLCFSVSSVVGFLLQSDHINFHQHVLRQARDLDG